MTMLPESLQRALHAIPKYLREHPEPNSPGTVIQALIQREGDEFIREIDLREAVWILTNRETIELTSSRKLELIQPSGAEEEQPKRKRERVPNAHYFETGQPVSPNRIRDLLQKDGIEIRQYRNPLPKHAGVILTPWTIRTIWELATGLTECNGNCQGTGEEHRQWEDLTKRQKLAFNERVIQMMNNSLLRRPATSLLTLEPGSGNLPTEELGRLLEQVTPENLHPDSWGPEHKEREN